MLEGGELEEEDQQPLAVLLENSLKLNEKFREETAAVYFAFLGCHDEFGALYRFDILADSYWRSRFLDALNMLADLIVSGVRMEWTSVLCRADIAAHHQLDRFSES
jgi:hypothetical protein